jgi:hypothetical protein
MIFDNVKVVLPDSCCQKLLGLREYWSGKIGKNPDDMDIELVVSQCVNLAFSESDINNIWNDIFL